MVVSSYDTFILPLLRLLADGLEGDVRDLPARLATKFDLSESSAYTLIVLSARRLWRHLKNVITIERPLRDYLESRFGRSATGWNGLGLDDWGEVEQISQRERCPLNLSKSTSSEGTRPRIAVDLVAERGRVPAVCKMSQVLTGAFAERLLLVEDRAYLKHAKAKKLAGKP